MDLNTWLRVGVLTLSVAAIIIGRISSDVRRLERKPEAVLKHSGIDFPVVAEKEAAELARTGKKIEAIKVYRVCTGAGLAEAKAAIERLQLGGQR